MLIYHCSFDTYSLFYLPIPMSDPRYVGETGANSFQLKSLFVKCMLDALFPSTPTFNVLFVLIK